jgi:hypothetical protein
MENDAHAAGPAVPIADLPILGTELVHEKWEDQAVQHFPFRTFPLSATQDT